MKVANIQEDIEKDRSTYIGGSDAGAIVGVNPYKSEYTLWAEKTNKIDHDYSQNEAMLEGHDLEEYVAQRFALATGKKIRRSNARYSIQEHPYIVAHIDRLIAGESAGLECKTASPMSKFDYENGEFPEWYIIQCLHYMLTTGKKHWYLAVLVFQKGLYWTRIDWDNIKINQLLAAEIHFWTMVLSGIAPEVDGSEDAGHTLDQLHKVVDEEVDLSALEEEMRILVLKQQEVKEAKAEIQDIQNQIKQAMGDCAVGHTPHFEVTYRPYLTHRFDSAKFKQEHPADYELYCDVSQNQKFNLKEIK